jgi:hypothetical protein
MLFLLLIKIKWKTFLNKLNTFHTTRASSRALSTNSSMISRFVLLWFHSSLYQHFSPSPITVIPTTPRFIEWFPQVLSEFVKSPRWWYPLLRKDFSPAEECPVVVGWNPGALNEDSFYRSERSKLRRSVSNTFQTHHIAIRSCKTPHPFQGGKGLLKRNRSPIVNWFASPVNRVEKKK